MGYVYGNLTAPRNTTSGIADYVLLAAADDFEVDGIKCPQAPFLAKGDQVTVKESHVFKTGKGFAKYSLAPEKNSLTAKPIGDKGSTKFDFEVVIFVPGSYAEVHEEMKNWLNRGLIALSKDSACGENFYYQVGCECIYAYMSPTFTTGTTKDGTKGYNVTISYQNEFVQLHKPSSGVITLLADAVAPSAPTVPLVDDTANSFDWTNTTGFTALTDYEYTTDGGNSFIDVTAKPITGLTGAHGIGQVGVRVKAVGVNPASATLFNATAYTA